MARGLVAEGEHRLGGQLGEADVARLVAVGRIAPASHALGHHGQEHVGDLPLVADRGLLEVEIDDLPAGWRRVAQLHGLLLLAIGGGPEFLPILIAPVIGDLLRRSFVRIGLGQKRGDIALAGDHPAHGVVHFHPVARHPADGFGRFVELDVLGFHRF